MHIDLRKVTFGFFTLFFSHLGYSMAYLPQQSGENVPGAYLSNFLNHFMCYLFLYKYSQYS